MKKGTDKLVDVVRVLIDKGQQSEAILALAGAIDELRIVQAAQELADSFNADPEQSLRDMVRELAGPGREQAADAVSDQMLGIISRVVIEHTGK